MKFSQKEIDTLICALDVASKAYAEDAAMCLTQAQERLAAQFTRQHAAARTLMEKLELIEDMELRT